MQRYRYWRWLGLIAPAVFMTSAEAAEVMATKTLGAYKVELHVLPAEPFFTKEEVAAKHVTDGMEIQSGAAPVKPDDPSHPNHHLVVHVFDAKSGKALTDAKVTMNYSALDRTGKPGATSTDVPIVVMQAVGKGPDSTHWGNNVSMPPGQYQVAVTVNDASGVFKVKASDSAASGGKMNMGKMKM